MKKITALIFSILYITVNAQSFNPKTITLPKNIEIEDLSFLKEELKNVQVIMLGENSHLDGNVFEMKTKVVKYLHQEMGFNTIAFESGIYDVWKAQTDINKGFDTQKAFIKSLFTIWAKKNEFQSFIEFYDKNKTDLKLFGFDNQITGKYGEEELVKDLYAYCKKYHLKLKFKSDDFSLLIESMSISGVFDEGDISYTQYKSSLTELCSSIAAKPQNEEHFYWSQIIKGLLTLGEERYLNIQNPNSFYCDVKDNIRDRQMAENLLTYIKKHPDEKIICWGANVHFANDMSSVNTPVLKEFIPMGSYIKSELKDEAYSLATVTASDSIFLQNKWHQTPINTTSFEHYLKNSNAPHLFISSNQPEMKKTQLNRLFSPITFAEARLDLVHDGYLYLNESKLTTPILNDGNDEQKTKNQNVISPEKNILNQINKIEFDTTANTNTIALKEIIVYSKRTPWQIVKKAIDNLGKNYPNVPLYSKMFTNLTTDIQDKTCLNLDITANQYEKSYFNYERSTKQLKEIRWNLKKEYEPKNLREFYSLIANNPIRNGAFLTNRKFIKFDFTLEEIKKHNNKDVYVITFSSPRNHSNYTGRVYLSNFTGTLFINKDDYAIVKVIENWEVTEFPEQHREGLNLNGAFTNYTMKEYINETIETDLIKSENFYFISHSEINITGKIINAENKSLPFKTTLDSYWSDFNITNPEKISNNEEQHLFQKVIYNEEFWKTYKLPN
ncbi:hypothetical protein FEDK69T_01760 [Flavobacterium enshiense DK69]|uniref:Haem-binding uptake Tiki superfamily ChaN domain-containing protein n=1 Tax=Flavobacterium enshiense DK69 TaxID=1107311 RepID=V6SG35_9FLAO|nr:erythromycin esterase family protein [Flavobacterium enshiense]ESU25207.1 hypothetical protein FEDK69T_01760 [Flavobacterium enshiense DK69]KGO96899.1 hypothetical protein Q767_04175 [Flavobacterium enshiense DK69]